ncbi:ArsR/SmtB family transcription factor [Saccharospirillum mangrovi]|uniref:ArsR/SmtB family transcription factor n=1 Tax=Saccharospirillum mangrovi TaxID=2161747 RepID=UPI000D3B8E1A|nr:metalloregulator ArsR/SmtB family transcription factor [Saccharospirillum mangrovi]
MTTPDVFTVLANPTRRHILRLLREQSLTAGDLARQFDLKRPAVSEHLQMLRKVGLVREEISGRNRIYHLDAGPLLALKTWLNPFESYWQQRLSDLKDTLNDEAE